MCVCVCAGTQMDTLSILFYEYTIIFVVVGLTGRMGWMVI